ncbi:hypothetical protein IPM44_03020 [bacterium]|nr:MAG: hypothetical protein IPM44_03020 [bacterium]
MAQSKKASRSNLPARAKSRDRKHTNEKKMRVSGKGVFTLARLTTNPKDSKKSL